MPAVEELTYSQSLIHRSLRSDAAVRVRFKRSGALFENPTAFTFPTVEGFQPL